MSRSVWKGPFVDGYVLKKAEKQGEGFGQAHRPVAQCEEGALIHVAFSLEGPLC